MQKLQGPEARLRALSTEGMKPQEREARALTLQDSAARDFSANEVIPKPFGRLLAGLGRHPRSSSSRLLQQQPLQPLPVRELMNFSQLSFLKFIEGHRNTCFLVCEVEEVRG